MKKLILPLLIIILLQSSFAQTEEAPCLFSTLKTILFGQKKAQPSTVAKTVKEPEILTAKVKPLWNGEELPMAFVNGKALEPRILPKTYYGNSDLPLGYKSIDDVFEKGLPSRGDNWDLHSHSEELWRYKTELKGKSDSAFRGTTSEWSSPDGGAGAINWADEGGYVFEISGVPGWDINMALEGKVQRFDGSFRGNLMHGEQEIAIPSKIPGRFICRIGRPTLSSSGRLIIRETNWIVNPKAARPPCP